MKLLEIGGTSSVNAYLFLGDYASMLLQQRPSVIDFPLRTSGRKNTIDRDVFCAWRSQLEVCNKIPKVAFGKTNRPKHSAMYTIMYVESPYRMCIQL